MRINPSPMKVVWKTWAVMGDHPGVFAERLAAALQELTDEGYSLVSQMPRDGAIIITGQKTDGVFSVAEAAHLGLTPPASFSNRRRLVEPPKATIPEPSRSEALYHYLQDGEQKQEWFERFGDAMALVRRHLASSDILPIRVVAVSHFEPEAFPALLEAFPENKLQE